MRSRFLITLLAIPIGAYVLLHLALGSSPIQKIVLAELQGALARFGIDLQIESIEFSALTPKIYLNRVTLTTRKGAIINLDDPVGIDKVKIEFQPISLISKRIVISEVTLFHPQVNLPKADALYRRVEQILKEKKSFEVSGDGSWPVVLKKMGVVDALFDVASDNPSFIVRSRSLSFFLEQGSHRRQFSVQSSNLEVKRGALTLLAKNVDIDVDLTDTSIRVNRGIVMGENLSINVKGTSGLPVIPNDKALPSNLKVNYAIELPLLILNQIPELGISKLFGNFTASGTASFSQGKASGDGQVEYKNLVYDDYKIGRGKMRYHFNPSSVAFTSFEANYAGGIVSSSTLSIGLEDRFPIHGKLQLQGLLMEGLLEALNTPQGVHTKIDGELKVAGHLSGPFDIRGELKGDYNNLIVLKHGLLPLSEKNTVMKFGSGDLRGELGFLSDRFTFKAQVGSIGGTVVAEGFVSYHNTAKIRGWLDGVSLHKLKEIAGLSVGGDGRIVVEVEVNQSDVRAAGTFDLNNSEIAKIVLGQVKGQIYYQNLLLSFENLEIPSLEPIRGDGYIDFSPQDDIRYKFNADLGRTQVDQVFGLFRKLDLSFEIPHGGEATGRIAIRGGHDDRGIEVVASGRARGFDWYDETWVSATYVINYRPDVVEINRATLFKTSGALDISGLFKSDKTRLTFKSNSLRVEDFDRAKGSSLAGELQGEVTIEGTPKDPFSSGQGEARLLRATFRGQELPDSSLKVKPEPHGLEFLGSFFGEKLRCRFLRGKGSQSDELLIYFQHLDLMPLLALTLEKDISTITSVLASGDLSLKGNLSHWESIEGGGSFSNLEVGLRGTPLKNTQPILFKFDRGVADVAKFYLTGVDGEVSGHFKYHPSKSVEGELDGRLDLQYLQTFVPILEYGTGKTLVSLRLSGDPKKYKLLGNVGLEEGTIRFTGLKEEFKNARLQMSVTQDALNFERFEANVNGGRVRGSGNIAIGRFSVFRPNLQINADRVEMKFQESFTSRLSGDFTLRGDGKPYLVSSDRCTLLESRLRSFETEKTPPTRETPALQFDINCEAPDKLFVQTDVLDAELKGKFHVVGDTEQLGLLGRAESLRGYLFFRDTRFNIESASAKFNSPKEIQPSFRVVARAAVREQKATNPQEYEINLQSYGTPQNYKILLSSSPSLPESDIISLLMLGVTGRDEMNYVGLGTTLAAQVPLQAKVGKELGVDIRIKSQSVRTDQTQSSNSSGGAADSTVPTVQIQKEITKKTKVSFSNSLNDAIPIRELRIEQLLDENLTVNATTVNRARGATEAPSQSYGLDFRFRFQFD